MDIYVMNESIKSKSSIIKTFVESDSEQYHEIDQGAIWKETSFTLKTFAKNIDEYDFFTQHEVKPKEAKKRKKKKEKNKKTLNLMDLINTELAITEPPIRKNVITMVNYNKEQSTLYLKHYQLQNIFQRNQLDIERG